MKWTISKCPWRKDHCRIKFFPGYDDVCATIELDAREDTLRDFRLEIEKYIRTNLKEN